MEKIGKIGIMDYGWPLYGIIDGHVYEEYTNQPLEKVIVKIKNPFTAKQSFFSTTTDENGYFTLKIKGDTMGPKPTEENYQNLPKKFFNEKRRLFFEKPNYQSQETIILVSLKVFLLPQHIRTKEDREIWEEDIFKEKTSEIPHAKIPFVYLRKIE